MLTDLKQKYHNLPPKQKILLYFLIPALLVSLTAFFWMRIESPPETQTLSDKSLQDYFKIGQELISQEPNAQSEVSTTFLAVGDISLSRGIAYAIDQTNNIDTPFLGMENILLSTDFNFGNLETPFSSSDRYTAKNTLVFNAPKKNITGLKNFNFKVLSLANNHAFDQGLDGIKTTRSWLAEHQISPIGTGVDLSEAWTPAVIEHDGIKVGFIAASYASINDGGKAVNNFVARLEQLEYLQSAIQTLKLSTDFVVVSMHGGTEYTVRPTQAQIDFAHSAIDAGAHLVIGHHPHWIQEKEYYCSYAKSKSRSMPLMDNQPLEASLFQPNENLNTQDHCAWIYYSLGNFIFDQSWSEKTKEGLALKVTLTKSTPAGSGSSLITPVLQELQPASAPTLKPGIQIEEIPIYIENNCCPTVKSLQ